MAGGIQLNGLLSVVIFFATVGLLAIVVLICGAVYLLGRYAKHERSKWLKYFFLSAITLLVIDGIFCLWAYLQGNVVLTQDEAIAFDECMFYIWAPCHVVGYFLLVGIFHVVHLRKGKTTVLV